MIRSELTFRVRYNEVDRMGYVHHGVYAAYFEMGRTELMREYGITYKEMEDSGVLLPLSEFSVKYLKPALYDELLRMETTLADFSGVRLTFTYKIVNKANEILAEGITPLVFVSAATRKPIRPSVKVYEKLADFFGSVKK
jgi:acyl-CoA thioester hydrolase